MKEGSSSERRKEEGSKEGRKEGRKEGMQKRRTEGNKIRKKRTKE